jgi:Zn2+/Cd2+-exporting ATPase
MSGAPVDLAQEHAKWPGATVDGAGDDRLSLETGETVRPWVFSVGGMDCADCARTVEMGVARLPGVASASVNFGSGTMTVHPAGQDTVTRQSIVSTVEQAGYTARERAARGTATLLPWWRSRRTQLIAAAMALWAVAFALERAGSAPLWSAVPFLMAMVIAGLPIYRAAWFALRRRRMDMNVLMAIAATGAVAIGEFGEGSLVLVLFAVGSQLQSMTLERTRHAIDALLELAPDMATVRHAGVETRVPVDQTRPGDIVIVRPGERIPVDGEIVAGESAVDQAAITGESTLVSIEPGATVHAGTINSDGLIEVRSTRRAADSTLARIIHLVEEAQASRAPAQAFVDRFAAIYTPVVVAGALVLATVVPLIAGDVRDWVFTALVLLVVACPCALVISTPVALVNSIGAASRRGVLFKGGAAVERLAGVHIVALDKTGTLTAGLPEVVEIRPLDGWSAGALLQMAAAIERGSTHPLAAGIVRAAEAEGLPRLTATGGRTVPGRGAEGRVEGVLMRAGGRKLFEALPEEVEAIVAAVEAGGRTAIIVEIDGEVAGIIAMADAIRPTARTVIEDLRGMRIRTVMLTGDNRLAAERVATGAGIDDVVAGLLPDGKVDAVADLESDGPVAMIGDGVNDAPALARASVGVAMGAIGSDAAIEAADVALLNDDLSRFPGTVRLARKTLRIIRENVAASVIVKFLVLGLTFVGITNLWLAVLADMGMSLLVTLNSLRLGVGIVERRFPFRR